jgi:hypothetical protein
LVFVCVQGYAVDAQTGEIVERIVEQPTNDVADKAAETATEKVAEKLAEKAAEHASEIETEKAELTAQRPDAWWRPTRVHFFVFVVDIDSIDDANQNFEANVYIRLRWTDERLANPGGATRQVPLSEVWNPRVLLANRQGLVSKSLPDVVQVAADGTVIYHQRYSGKMSQPLRLSDFPMDSHTFTIHFVATGYQESDLEFVPDNLRSVEGGAIADELSLPDWQLLGYEVLPLAYTPIEFIQTAGFVFRFQAERYVAYYLWQVVLPLAVVVVMSWAAFWVGREHVGVRIGVATSSILTLIAHRFVLASLLPRLPYMTRMDYFTVGSTLLVFMALLVVVVTAFLSTRGRDRPARRVDILARVAFPGAFVWLLVWFFFAGAGS